MEEGSNIFVHCADVRPGNQLKKLAPWVASLITLYLLPLLYSCKLGGFPSQPVSHFSTVWAILGNVSFLAALVMDPSFLFKVIVIIIKTPSKRLSATLKKQLISGRCECSACLFDIMRREKSAPKKHLLRVGVATTTGKCSTLYRIHSVLELKWIPHSVSKPTYEL